MTRGIDENAASARTPISRLAALGELSAAEIAYFREMAGPPVSYGAREVIRQQGEPNQGVYLLHEGWAVSSVGFADGSRQIVKVHLPSDIMGAPSMPYATTVATLSSLTPVKVSTIPSEAFGDLFERMPRLAALMFLATQEERVVLMDRLAALGRLGAAGSVAALLVHLHDRLSLSEPVHSTRIQIPLTQSELGDILGLTSVHVNRVLNAMERAGQLRRHGRVFDLIDLEALRARTGMPQRRPVRNLGWLPSA